MPINPARTMTTSASTGARPGRSGTRSKQPSKVRTVSHNSPRASARHSMSQNVIHQRTSLPRRRRAVTTSKSWKTATTGLRHARPAPAAPTRIDPTRIGQPAPTITASPTLTAIARLWRAIQTASARPTLAIKAPWARIVAISRQAPKSTAPSDNSS